MGCYGIIQILIQILLGVLLVPCFDPSRMDPALAYKSQGKQTSFDANLKGLLLAIADKFVTSKREFIIVALAPFLVISLALLITSS